MINFFRNIRKRLAVQNKSAAYLRYAIGEIFLVVIGILIALQINNWNSDRKTKEKEKQVLTEIISDLDSSLDEIEFVLNGRTNNLNRTVKSINILLNVLETNKPYHDSLGYYFRAANAYDYVNFKTSGYQSLISIGTDLIEDPNIRSRIGQFYTSSLEETKETFDEIKLDFHGYMLDYYRKYFTLEMTDDSKLELLIPIDFETLKNDNEYIQALKVFVQINASYRDILLELIDEITILKNDIENYLN